MGGIKVVLVLGLVVAGIMGVISAIAVLMPYILAVIGFCAIAEVLDRLSGGGQPVSPEKDETHSPFQTRPQDPDLDPAPTHQLGETS